MKSASAAGASPRFPAARKVGSRTSPSAWTGYSPVDPGSLVSSVMSLFLYRRTTETSLAHGGDRFQRHDLELVVKPLAIGFRFSRSRRRELVARHNRHLQDFFLQEGDQPFRRVGFGDEYRGGLHARQLRV